MKIEHLIQNIYNTNKVFDAQNNEYQVGITSISKKKGVFIQDIIKNNDIQNTIEIGCAYGVSSLFICAGLKDKKTKHHTVIDPFQSSTWKSIGVNNLKKANVDYYKLIEEPSEIALPKLLIKNKKYDLGFIDGWHTFDHTLIDFFT